MTFAIESRTATGISALASGRPGVPADPHGLTWMLMDEALEQIEAARGQDPQERADGVPTNRLLQSAALLIDQLRAGLDLRHGGAFAANVDDLYDYMSRRLHAAVPGKSDRTAASALNEVSHLLEALRSAWRFMPAEVRTRLPVIKSAISDF